LPELAVLKASMVGRLIMQTEGSDSKYLDPIAYAWRACNPRTPLPARLIRWMPSWLGVTTSMPASLSGSNGAHAAALDIRFGLLQMSIGAAPPREENPSVQEDPLVP
jgi:hypothetical protein